MSNQGTMVSQSGMFETEKEAMQDAFNTVRDHLLKQMANSVNATDYGLTNCMYRRDDGLKCAVGCLIPDDKYAPEMEGNLADLIMLHRVALPMKYTMWMPYDLSALIKSRMYSVLYRLQLLHDESETEYWENHLFNLSVELGLDDPEGDADV